MMISTKGRYALRVMIDLAEHSSGRFIPLRDIAGRQGISEKYLESIIAVLTREGYLEGLRGKGGGYRLTRAPGDYNVYEILSLAEGSLAPVNCLECGHKPCERADDCRTLPMWKQFYEMTAAYFSGIKLSDLARRIDDGDNYII